jgi:hypothetical protein
MVLPFLLLIGQLITSAPDARGPDWAAAYEKGDYGTASTLLHRLIMESDEPHLVDTFAFERLAAMYLKGQGVEADPIMACALLNHAYGAAMFTHHEGTPITVRAERLRNEECGRLTHGERMEAVTLVGTLRVGPKPEVFHLDQGRWVEVSRRGVRIEDRGQSHDVDIPNMGWGTQIPLVRHTVVEPPIGSPGLRARHVLEFFEWCRGRPREGQPRRALMWTALEVNGSKLEGIAQDTLVEEPGSIWPAAGVPAGVLEGIAFEMTPSGAVRWRTGGRPWSR